MRPTDQPRRQSQTRSTERGMTRTSDMVHNTVHGAVRATASRVGIENSRLAKQAYRQLDATKRQWDEAEQNIREYIKENPEKAALIAAGVGVAIGAALATMVKNR